MSNRIADALRSEIWAMEPVALDRFLARVEGIPSASVPEAFILFDPEGEEDAGPGYSVADGVARIPISGPILKSVPAIFKFFGINATGTVETEAAIHAALADSSVESILLDIDSPGGTVSGVADLGETISKAGAVKPVAGHAQDLMASAAYWLGSQAGTLTAGRNAEVGSIGVYSVMVDSSEAARAEGVKVHVLSSHELKGAGVPGSEITPAQLADTQRLIDAIADRFVEAVSLGRRMDLEKVRESATGQVWLGDEAEARGLIDATVTASEAHELATYRTGESAPAGMNQEAQPSAEENQEMADNANPEILAEIEAQRAEIEQMKADLEAEKAALEEQRTIIAADTEAANQAACAAIIDAHANRVTPAIRESVEAFAASVGNDPAKVRAFVEGLPVQTRADAEGENVDNEIAEPVSDEDAQVARMFGLDPEKVRKARELGLASVDISGQGYDASGCPISLEVN